jgi:hypothetical protein
MRLVRVEGGRESSLALSMFGERLAVCRLELAASTLTDADMLSGGIRGMSRDHIYRAREEVC